MARTSTFWIKLAAESLNIPADEFVKALRQGQTPAQIAEAHGVSGQALIDAMLQIQRRQLEEVVKAGNMKHQRMERILADQSKALKKWVKKGPPPPRGNR
jgi:DNA-directed RNA polymerase specialized sigma subunit